MLAIAALLRAVRVRHALPFLFIGNVGEEGEGDLRGMRHIFRRAALERFDRLQPGPRRCGIGHDRRRSPGQPPV